jgi:hypothetical protein
MRPLSTHNISTYTAGLHNAVLRVVKKLCFAEYSIYEETCNLERKISVKKY